MDIIKVNIKNIKQVINAAMKTLRAGGIIAYPTETFYALGCQFDMEVPLKRLYLLKNRPAEKAMPLIIGQISSVYKVASHVNGISLRLMEKFWPGPLTILLPAKKGLNPHITHKGKVALRVPGESFGLNLALNAGFPITATSANPSAMPPAQTAKEVLQYFGADIDLIIDGGKTKGGLPSTIVDAAGPKLKIIRQGGLNIEPLKLRGHHLICLQFFKGQGSDKRFIEHLKDTLKDIKNKSIKICHGADDICRKCPYLIANKCLYSKGSEKEIKAMDSMSLKLLKFKTGSEVKWNHIKRLLPQIFHSWYNKWCKGCDWQWACRKSLFYKTLKKDLP